MQMVLTLTGFPGQYPVTETISAMTLPFWLTFHDELSSASYEVHGWLNEEQT